MRAATTKIPHLPYEKGLLKTPNVVYDFIYNLWFTMNVYNGDGRGKKNKKKKRKDETKEKIFPV